MNHCKACTILCGIVLNVSFANARCDCRMVLSLAMVAVLTWIVIAVAVILGLGGLVFILGIIGMMVVCALYCFDREKRAQKRRVARINQVDWTPEAGQADDSVVHDVIKSLDGAVTTDAEDTPGPANSIPNLKCEDSTCLDPAVMNCDDD